MDRALPRARHAAARTVGRQRSCRPADRRRIRAPGAGRRAGHRVVPFPRRHDIGHRHREGGDRQGLNPTAQRRPLRGLRYPCTKTPDWVYGFSGIRTAPGLPCPPLRRGRQWGRASPASARRPGRPSPAATGHGPAPGRRWPRRRFRAPDRRRRSRLPRARRRASGGSSRPRSSR